MARGKHTHYPDSTRGPNGPWAGGERSHCRVCGRIILYIEGNESRQSHWRLLPQEPWYADRDGGEDWLKRGGCE